ncbi:hypothetical protein M1N42_04870, partial [Thermodesulfovibrionales bacterium]|nr:hypothetical protein [Thermodesulfovibrionales bacterium]
MKKDLAYFTAVNDTLKEMKGIAAVTSNSVVGSAVILYDEKRVTQNSILAKLDELFSARYRPERESSIKTVTGSG